MPLKYGLLENTLNKNHQKLFCQGNKQVLSNHLEQVYFPSGQVTFHSHLMGKGSGKLSTN